MNNLTVKELRAICKEMGITKYSRLKKEHLIITIQAEQARLEREAKRKAMINEVRELSDRLEERYTTLGYDTLANEQFDSYICFAINAEDARRMEQLEDLCQRYLEKYKNRMAELDFAEEQRKKKAEETPIDPKEVLAEANDLICKEFKWMATDELDEHIMEAIGSSLKSFVRFSKEDKIKFLVGEIKDNLRKKESAPVTFNPENTAIDTRFSTSADMIAKEITVDTPVLDYGCGTGRNMRHIIEKTGAVVDGTDIPEQLEKEKDKHDQLRAKGSIIANNDIIPDEYYKVALNSHVLNVIESDAVKQFVVNDIYKKLTTGGKAYIEVRTKQDVEGAKTKEPHGDGWKIKCKGGYTYQEGVSKEKMITLVTNAGFKIEKHICNSSKHIVVVAK